jgi:dynein heavy chain
VFFAGAGEHKSLEIAAVAVHHVKITVLHALHMCWGDRVAGQTWDSGLTCMICYRSNAPLLSFAASCCQVHAVYALLDEYKIKMPDVDRAGYASLDSTYAGLKALMEEVEAGKEEAVAKYSAGLESGELLGCWIM